MLDLFDVVRVYFELQDVDCQVDARSCLLQTRLQGEHGQWPCLAWVVEPDRLFAVASWLPVWVPSADRQRCARWLGRINTRLPAGTFELNHDNGLVQFTTAAELTPENCDFEAVDSVVSVNLALTDRYLPAIRAMLRTTSWPRYELARAEGRFIYWKR